MKDNGGCFTNAFLILGLIALALTLTYRFAFYARYLNFDKTEVVLDWTGGEQEIWVSTDGNSWTIDDKETAWWLSYQKWGNYLRISAYENDDKEERSTYVKINSGSIKGLGNKWDWLRVVQQGKRASFLNASKQMVSFPSQGGSESIQINTDGDAWRIVDGPNWVSQRVSGNSIVLKASQNNGKQREGTVYIQSDQDLQLEIKIVQYGNLLYTYTDSYYCDGIYDYNEPDDRNGHGFHTPNMSSLNMNQHHFRVVFSFKAMSYDGMWAIMLDRSYRRLGVYLNRDGTIWISTNNQENYYPTYLTYSLNSFVTLDMEFNHGTIIVNNTTIQVEMGELHDTGFHSINYSNGTAFKGYIKDFSVYSYP